MKHKGLGLQVLFFIALIIGGMCIPHQAAYAATTATAVQVASVEYYDDDVVVFNNDNTKIYYALDTDAANGNWDVMPADDGVGDVTTIDTSWIPDGDESVLMIKGNLESTPTRVVLKQKPLKLTMSINYSSIESLQDSDKIGPVLNIMSTEGNGESPITFDDLEWKKGDNGKWRSTDSLTKAQLEKYLVKGTYLYFRIRAIDDYVSCKLNGTNININNDKMNGSDKGMADYANSAGFTHGNDYPDGLSGRRFSEPYKLKISKKAPTAVTNIDGEKFKAKLKYGKEYKVTARYANNVTGSSNWVQITDRSVSAVDLATMVNALSPRYTVNGQNVNFDGLTVPFPQMDIEVRDFATDKSVSSETSTISLDEQRVMDKAITVVTQPNVTLTQNVKDVFLYYFGNKYIVLTIPMASASLPYEYCVVKDGDQLDLKYATWYVVTKNTGVKILANKAPQDATIYVRQREIKAKAGSDTTAAVSYKLASTYITRKLDYPSIPVVSTSPITYIKKYSTAPTITVQLNESHKTPFETTLKNVKLGSKEIGATFTVSASTTDSTISIMTIKLDTTDLETMTNCTNRALTITFGNGIVDKTSVKITIQSSMESAQLALSASQGGTTGNTKISTINSLGAGNTWIYETSQTAVTGLTVQDVLAADKTKVFTSPMEIPIQAGQYVIVYEIDTSTRHILKYKCMQITAAMIK